MRPVPFVEIYLGETLGKVIPKSSFSFSPIERFSSRSSSVYSNFRT